ncbi:MAG: fumarate hydratase [Candidatus Njordarchaeia archaeon]
MRFSPLEEKVLNSLVSLIKLTETVVSYDVIRALKMALEKEKDETAKSQLRAMIKNAEVANFQTLPICQDTGLLTFHIKLGEDFPIKARLNDIIVEASKKATEIVPLRPNAVDPITGKNTGNNIGGRIPWITYELTEGDKMEVFFLPKGGGSSYVVSLTSIPPSQGLKGFKRSIIEAVVKAGPKPCPPVTLGIGLGGTEDMAIKLGAKALFRKLDDKNPDPALAQLESELLEMINSLGIGPAGLGGNTTALAVKIEKASRHPATFLIGIVFQCWTNRRGHAIIYENGEMDVILPEVWA